MMECEYIKLLCRDANGKSIYVCCCEGSRCFGKEPVCEKCEEREKEKKE